MGTSQAAICAGVASASGSLRPAVVAGLTRLQHMTGRAWIDELPDELAGQKAIMRRLLDACEADDRIRWLAVSCSVGRGAGDRLSDLDMGLGVRDEDFDSAITDIRVVVDGLADLVDSYHHLLPEVKGPHERIFAQYANRCQLDLVVFPASTDIGGASSVVALYDADNTIVVRTQRPPATPKQVREWAFRGWCCLADVGKYLRRGSAWEALAQLHEARNCWWQLWAVAHEVRDARYGIISILDFAPGIVRADAAGTVPRLDLAELTSAAQNLAELLGGVGACLSPEYRAVLPDPMAAYIIADLESLTAERGGADSWAPADCTLPTAERPIRVAEFSDLFSHDVLTVDRPEAGRLRLGLRPGREAASRVAALTAAETECCSFFTFTLTVGNDSLSLDIGVPESRTEILDALADRAAAGVAGS
jgi:hypothetical protein